MEWSWSSLLKQLQSVNMSKQMQYHFTINLDVVRVQAMHACSNRRACQLVNFTIALPLDVATTFNVKDTCTAAVRRVHCNCRL